MDKVQVDTVGKQSASVKHILGVLSKPVTGIFEEPLMNFNTSPKLTPSGLLKQSNRYSFQKHMIASSFVRLLEPFGEYCMAKVSQRYSGVTSNWFDAAHTLIITFHDHPVLGARQNNSTIGSSPDPLPSREGLASETRVPGKTRNEEMRNEPFLGGACT